MSKISVPIVITNNNPSYNSFIIAFIQEAPDSEKKTSFEEITIFFSSKSSSLSINYELSNSTKDILYGFVLLNSLKFTEFIVDEVDSVTYFEINDPIPDINTAISKRAITSIQGRIAPTLYREELNTIFFTLNVAPINITNTIIKTDKQILTETVTKSAFNLVEEGLTLCQIESLKQERLGLILNNIDNLRTYSRENGSNNTVNNNGSINQAGLRYTESFPSVKFANSVGINELLLNKKKYMFSNSLNKNVVSGPISFNSFSGYTNNLPYTSGSYSGLTKVQQFANAARGRTPSGGPGRRYGVQFYDGRSLVSIPNIYNPTATQRNQPINICAFR